MTRTPTWRRAAAALAVGALAVMGGASVAHAAPTIDPAATGTLYVHKRLNPTGTLSPADGLEDAAAPGTPLADIAFDVQRVTAVDLTETAGWEEARALAADPSTLTAGDLGPVVTQVTVAPDGIATFAGLPVGAYLVTERLTPAQVASGLTAAAPFVVTIPMTHPTDLDTWVYDVHVYPKNLQSSVTKTVDDGPGTTYAVGDRIGWTVTAPAPAQTTTTFVFKDVLSTHLAIPAPAADNISVSIGGTPLAAADLTVEYDEATDNTLVVRLTASGLATLNAVAGTPVDIELAFETTVVSLPADGMIENAAVLFPNDAFPETGPGIETPPVESRFGELNILKQESGSATALAGAEFMVFASEADALAYAADPGANAALPLRAQQNGTGALVDRFVTGVDGTVSVTGLRASNWQDGALLTDPADYQGYWLLETKAPSGYELATAPIGAINVLFDSAAPAVLPFGDVTVPNVLKPELPLTGGQIASGVFGLLGALVLSGGVLLVIRARRQSAGA
ncbi:SpaH/EbpB family LPXTG-anchored major pilin [Sanguibacter sp. A247]|uniref:SpaH/EbpB family LPXTG-anchored major pilin n=1 Tax=unclassified Sanguibacter TaxID=2645534 RepID=UPI003FD6EED0